MKAQIWTCYFPYTLGGKYYDLGHSIKDVSLPPKNKAGRELLKKCRYGIVYRQDLSIFGVNQYLKIWRLVASIGIKEKSNNPVLVICSTRRHFIPTVAEFYPGDNIPKDYPAGWWEGGDKFGENLTADEVIIFDQHKLKQDLWKRAKIDQPDAPVKFPAVEIPRF